MEPVTTSGRDGYRIERAPRPALARHVASVWTERSASSDRLLPDAAVELVWSGRGLFVRGADTRPHPVGSFPERTFVGIRFRPGAAADVVGLHGRELADARVGVSELWGRREMERLEARLAHADAPTAARILEDVVAERARSRPDPDVQAFVALVAAGRTGIASIAALIGLSERQLHRRTIAALGYSPKTLERILRFQRFLSLARTRRDLGLVELAAEAGYADQSHLTRECSRLAGRTPARLLAAT